MPFITYLRIIVLFIIYTNVPTQLMAQLSSSLSFSSLHAIGEFSNNHSPGLGAGLLFQYPIHGDFELLLSTDYIYMNGKDFEDKYLSYEVPSIHVIPVNLGLDFYLTQHWFLRGKGGMMFFRKPENSVGKNIEVGFGFRIKSWQASTSLIHWNKQGYANFIGFQLAYSFLKKT